MAKDVLSSSELLFVLQSYWDELGSEEISGSSMLGLEQALNFMSTMLGHLQMTTNEDRATRLLRELESLRAIKIELFIFSFVTCM